MTTFTYFEPLTSGHCTFWANTVLSAAAADPRVSRLRLITGPLMAERLTDLVTTTGLELQILPEAQLHQLEQSGLLARGRAQWAAARMALEKTGGQLFLPYFDHAVYGAITDRRTLHGQVSGIIFRPPNSHNYPPSTRRRLDTTRRWISYLIAKRPALRRLFTLDERASRHPISNVAQLLHFLPDPAPNMQLLDSVSQVQRSDGRRVLLLFGALTRRKGIFEILEAVKMLPTKQQAGLVLRFVGRLDQADSITFLERLSEIRSECPCLAIELEDRFVTDEELASEVMSCDVVLAPYQNHVGSSGVIYWAVAAGKPLIAQRTGLMGYQVERHGLGLPVDTTEPRALAAALMEAAAMPLNRDFLCKHTPEVFARTVLDGCLA